MGAAGASARRPASCATRDAQTVHQCPVVVLATGETAATWVLAVLAHAACAVRGEEREAVAAVGSAAARETQPRRAPRAVQEKRRLAHAPCPIKVWPRMERAFLSRVPMVVGACDFFLRRLVFLLF